MKDNICIGKGIRNKKNNIVDFPNKCIHVNVKIVERLKNVRFFGDVYYECISIYCNKKEKMINKHLSDCSSFANSTLDKIFINKESI